MSPSGAVRRTHERSRALHAAVVERLRADPELLARAAARVERWLTDGDVARPYAERWRAWLRLPLDELAAKVLDPSDEAQDMRQVSPFAGALDPRTRWRILRAVR